MANLVRNSSGLFSIRFRLGNQRFNRSLETHSEKEALEEKGKIEKTLRRVKEGEIDPPSNATPQEMWFFLRSSGRRHGEIKLAPRVTLEQTTKQYFAQTPEGSKERSSIGTEKTHVKHLERLLGGGTPLYGLTVERIQAYVMNRQKETGRHGKPIQADTIKKELQTFRQIWDFAVARGHVPKPFPLNEVKLPKRGKKRPFMTWEQIEGIIGRGGYDDNEKRDIWDCLFLRRREIEELLEYVRKHAAHPFIYPMFAFAAYTGARRSEILRSEVGDFDLDQGCVFIREKKRCRSASGSFRDIELAPKFKKIMAEWFGKHPGGRHAIVIPPEIIRSRRKALEPRAPTETQAHDHFKRTLAGGKWKVVRGFHVFRHSFASNLACEGTHQSIIDRWLGHQTAEMRDRYRHLFPEEKERAMEAMARIA